MVTRLAIVYLLQTSLVSPGAALLSRASNEGYAQVCEDFTITEKAPAMAFSWLLKKDTIRTL